MKLFYWTIFFILVFCSCKKDFSRQPVVSTGDFDLAAAIAHGTLVDLGTKEITDHGFCWDSVGEPNLGNSTIRLGALSATGGFQAQLLELSVNRTYFLKAFISFGDEVLFGAMITFTTPDLPEITTRVISEITETYAKGGGEITDDNGSPVIARGVCWGTSSNPDTTGYHTSDGTGIGTFESVLSGLSPNTQYYVRAYATSIYGTRYANEIEFNTGQSATTPFVSTTTISSITQTGASSGGNVVTDGGADVTLRSVCWSTTPYPTTDDSKTEDGSGTGVFSSSLTGLAANTTYYVRAYATNEIGTAYGNEVSCTTEQAPNLPTVITTAISNITQTSATSGGDVTADGGSPVTTRGICWSTSSNPTLSGSFITNGSGLGSFISELEELEEDTKYYVRAYATNSAGTSYGNENSFTTGQTTTSPTVTTDDVIDIAQTTATSGGDVTSDGGATVTVRGVCWSISQNPTTANSHSTDGNGVGAFPSSLTGLTANTTYYVRAYATNSAGTSYGNEKDFATLQEITLPSVSTAPVINITPSSAQSGGTVTDDGGATVSARGVCWSTSQNPDLGDSHTTDGTGTGSFTSVMAGLNPNTFYYVRAYATNNVGTSYGSQLTFMTIEDPVLPTVTTADPMNITQTEATTGGTVHTDGGATVTARGVCYSTTPDPTLSDSFTTNGSGLGLFVSVLTSLTPGTQYYVKAYATNSVGTTYGNEITFSTLYNITLPTITTDDATNITQLTATSGGNVTSDGGGTVTARGICWSTSTNPTISDSHTTDGSGTGTFVSYITGLTENTQYYVRAYATNSAGTAYGNEVALTTLADPTIPIVTTDDATNITQTTATSGGNVTSDGGANVTARGVCWNTSSNPTLSNSHTTDGSGTGTFVSDITGLTSNTQYYVRAYATNSAGTAYGNEIILTTHCLIIDNYGNCYFEVINPATAKIWLDRNLGANQVATSSNDFLAYGSLFQWGRLADAHEKITWTNPTNGSPLHGTSSTLSPTDIPDHYLFITPSGPPGDWRNPQNNTLWQGLNGTNNPCPTGYRPPTKAELEQERSTWGPQNSNGAFASPVKFVVAGVRGNGNGELSGPGSSGWYWSSTIDGTYSWCLNFGSGYVSWDALGRANGFSVRCIKN